MATIEDFERLDIRVGKIISCEEFLKAKKPAYKLKIDFGPLGIKNSSAQITKLYKKENLIGKQIIAVVNFPPRKIADFASEVLVLGAVESDGKVILLQPERETELGAKIA